MGNQMALLFKDSQGGTSTLELSDSERNPLRRHAPVKKRTQYAFAPRHSPLHQILDPAISEAAEPRCSMPRAIKLPNTPRRSEARPR
jgi:hypothetical protein